MGDIAEREVVVDGLRVGAVHRDGGSRCAERESIAAKREAGRADIVGDARKTQVEQIIVRRGGANGVED